MLRSVISHAFNIASLVLIVMVWQAGVRIGWTIGFNWQSALLLIVFGALNWGLESIGDRVLARFPKVASAPLQTAGSLK